MNNQNIEYYKKFLKQFITIKKFDQEDYKIRGVLVDIIGNEDDEKLVIQHLKYPEKQWIISIKDIKNITGDPVDLNRIKGIKQK